MLWSYWHVRSLYVHLMRSARPNPAPSIGAATLFDKSILLTTTGTRCALRYARLSRRIIRHSSIALKPMTAFSLEPPKTNYSPGPQDVASGGELFGSFRQRPNGANGHRRMS